MTDGVAMLTRAKENLIFTMSALPDVQRIALSQPKQEFIQMCSFNGKQCNIGMEGKLLGKLLNYQMFIAILSKQNLLLKC